MIEKCVSFLDQFCLFHAMMLICHVESFELFIHGSFSASIAVLVGDQNGKEA